MSDTLNAPVNALGGARSQGFVSIEELPPIGMVILRGDFTASKFKSAVKKSAGVAIPALRQVAQAGDNTLCWMSPDELLLVTGYDSAADKKAALDKALSGQHFMAEVVSDARAMFRVIGQPAQVRELIAKPAPVDMSADAFAPGDIRRSHIGQVAAAFWMVDDNTLHLVCFRSVARYVFDLLDISATKGSEVGLFA